MYELTQSRRRTLRTLGAVGGAGFAGCLDTLNSGDNDDVSLRLTVPVPRSTTFGRYVQDVSDQMNRRSDTITIEPFYGDELGPPAEQYEGVSAGTIDMAISGPDYLSTFGVPELRVLDAAYLFDDWDTAFRAHDPQESDLINQWNEDLINASDLRIVNPLTGGTRNFSLDDKACIPEDFSGKKIRAPGTEMMNAAVEAIGASPTSIPPGETAQALATGSINGIEQVLSLLSQEHVFESQSHIILTEHSLNTSILIINNETWTNLTAGQKENLNTISRDVSDEHLDWVVDSEEQLVDTFEEEGLEVVNPGNCLQPSKFEDMVNAYYSEEFPEYSDLFSQLKNM